MVSLEYLKKILCHMSESVSNLFGVACLIETKDHRYWLLPKYKYKDELQARVTAQHLEKMLNHFSFNDDLRICYFVQKLD